MLIVKRMRFPIEVILIGKSWRIDETYIKVKGAWKYLYRAVDKEGNTIDFLLTAMRFFKKAINSNDMPEN